MRLAVPLLLLLAGACAAPGAGRVAVHADAGEPGAPRLLAVVAHPDDETAFAATLFKAATHLGAACDVVVLTNGEGGFKYATLAERLYGRELTDEPVGRAHLPEIRRDEMLAGARLLGVRDVYFFNQADHRYTQDVDEVLGEGAEVWDLAAVRATLVELLLSGEYDFVLTHAPTPTTHAHHQAASLLAVEAAARLAPAERPVLLAAQTAELGEATAPAPATVDRPGALLLDAPPLLFDRTQPFGHRDRLDYRIVVNWVIAEHKSQGTMQLAVNGRPLERFFLYAANAKGARERAEAFFEALRGAQFEARDYGASAGTNAARA
ncbi:MAG: PIG-L family deacetylase [Planctomycetota bacterium]